MYARRLDKTGSVRLRSIATDEDAGLTREAAEERLVPLLAELSALQELLFAAGTHALLVVLQGRDTSGKDGTIKTIAGAMNPVGVRVASFKVPTPEELAHDFLWRVHRETPGRGQVVFFNRSHYEDVLVVRVHQLAAEAVWKRRYEHIQAFERNLADAGVLVAKFYLHLSKAEQERRLIERENDQEKAWKLNPGDWEERKYWDDYTAAYDDVLERCASPHAPWFVVPSDKKWFRNLAVAEALVETLRPHRKAWDESLASLAKTQRAALATLRQGRAK